MIPSCPSSQQSSAQLRNGSAQLSVQSVQRPDRLDGGGADARARRRRRRAAAAAACRAAAAAPTRASSCVRSSKPVCIRRREIRGRVERVDRRQHAAPEPFQAFRGRPRSRARAAFAVAWTSTAGSPCASSTPCSPTRQREHQVGQLPERARRAGIDAASLGDRVGDRPLQLQGRRAERRRSRGPRTGAARARAGEVAEHDGGVERAVDAGRVEAAISSRGAAVAAAAAAGRDQDDRPLRLPRGEDARQLEQRGGARQLRRRARAPPRRGGRGSGSAWRWSSRAARRSPSSGPFRRRSSGLRMARRGP